MNNEDRNTAAEVASNVNTEGAQASTIRRGDIYQEVTDRIIQAMETAKASGVASLWDGAGERAGLPLNHATGKPYSGINVLILWAAAGAHGYRSNRWLTYQQTKSAGGQVRKGEHGTQCVFYKPIEAEEVNEAGETEIKRAAVLKSFTVFNLDQVDGIEAPDATTVRPVFEARAEAERILKDSGARITEGGNQAYYQRATDSIRLPDRHRFHTPENFYATALHELTHWTGHESRLARTFGKRFGDEAYSMEELVAEIGAAFAIADLGMIHATIEQHASYLDSWLRVLKSDKKAIFTAAAQAARAHAYLMGRTAQAAAA